MHAPRRSRDWEQPMRDLSLALDHWNSLPGARRCAWLLASGSAIRSLAALRLVDGGEAVAEALTLPTTDAPGTMVRTNSSNDLARFMRLGGGGFLARARRDACPQIAPDSSVHANWQPLACRGPGAYCWPTSGGRCGSPGTPRGRSCFCPRPARSSEPRLTQCALSLTNLVQCPNPEPDRRRLRRDTGRAMSRENVEVCAPVRSAHWIAEQSGRLSGRDVEVFPRRVL